MVRPINEEGSFTRVNLRICHPASQRKGLSAKGSARLVTDLLMAAREKSRSLPAGRQAHSANQLSNSGVLPIETALSLCGRYLPASQSHGLEYGLVLERRFPIDSLLLIRLSGGGFWMPLIIVFVCIGCHFNPVSLP